jgi:hypothetical protein
MAALAEKEGDRSRVGNAGAEVEDRVLGTVGADLGDPFRQPQAPGRTRVGSQTKGGVGLLHVLLGQIAAPQGGWEGEADVGLE